MTSLKVVQFVAADLTSRQRSRQAARPPGGAPAVNDDHARATWPQVPRHLLPVSRLRLALTVRDPELLGQGASRRCSCRERASPGSLRSGSAALPCRPTPGRAGVPGRYVVPGSGEPVREQAAAVHKERHVEIAAPDGDRDLDLGEAVPGVHAGGSTAGPPPGHRSPARLVPFRPTSNRSAIPPCSRRCPPGANEFGQPLIACPFALRPDRTGAAEHGTARGREPIWTVAVFARTTGWSVQIRHSVSPCSTQVIEDHPHDAAVGMRIAPVVAAAWRCPVILRQIWAGCQVSSL